MYLIVCFFCVHSFNARPFFVYLIVYLIVLCVHIFHSFLYTLFVMYFIVYMAMYLCTQFSCTHGVIFIVYFLYKSLIDALVFGLLCIWLFSFVHTAPMHPQVLCFGLLCYVYYVHRVRCLLYIWLFILWHNSHAHSGVPFIMYLIVSFLKTQLSCTLRCSFDYIFDCFSLCTQLLCTPCFFL